MKIQHAIESDHLNHPYLDQLISAFPNFLSLLDNFPSDFDPNQISLFQIITLLDKFDEYLESNDVKLNEPEIKGILDITILLLRNKKIRLLYSSLDKMVHLLRKSDNLSIINKVFVIVFEVISTEGLVLNDYRNLDVEIIRISYLGKAYFLGWNGLSIQKYLNLYRLFEMDNQFERIKKVLKEQELNEIVQSGIRSWELSFTAKETMNYNDKTPINNSKSQVFSIQNQDFSIEPNEIISNLGLNIEIDSPAYDSLLVRLKYERLKEHPNLILETILKSSAINIWIIKLNSGLAVDQISNYGCGFISTIEVFSFIKHISSLFYLQLTPELHVLTLHIIEIGVNKLSNKQNKGLISLIFTHNELMQKILKDCASINIVENKEENFLVAKGFILNQNTIIEAKFVEKLLRLVKTKFVFFFAHEENHNIFTASSILSSLGEIFLAVSHHGWLKYSVKALMLIAEIFKEILPHQNNFPDFNVLETIRTRLEMDLLTVTQEKQLYIYKRSKWNQISIYKLLELDCFLMKIIESSFSPREHVGHQTAPALIRKILEGTFLLNLANIINVLGNSIDKKTDKILDSLITESVALISNIGLELPNLIGNILDLEIIDCIINQIQKKIPRNIRCIQKLIGFIHMICINPKGKELIKKKNLLNKIIYTLFEKDFIELVYDDFNSSSRNNCIIIISSELIRMMNNIPGYKEEFSRLLLELLKDLLIKQNDFMLKITDYFDNKLLDCKEILEYEFILKTLCCFVELLTRFFHPRFLDKHLKDLASPFIRFISFPLLAIVDDEMNLRLLKVLRTMGSNYRESPDNHGSILTEITNEITKLLKEFDGKKDLTSVITAEMAYIARNKGLKHIIEEKNIKYKESLILLGRITYIENLLEFASIAKLAQKDHELFPNVLKLEGIISNQLDGEDLFYLEKVIKDGKIQNLSEFFKTSNDPARFHFHNSLKIFLSFCLSTQNSKKKSNNYSLLAQDIAEKLRKLSYLGPNSKKPLDYLLIISNMYSRYYELIKELIRNNANKAMSTDLIFKFYDESVFEEIFKVNTIVFDTCLQLDFNSKINLDTFDYCCGSIMKILRVLLFMPCDLDSEIIISTKPIKPSDLKNNMLNQINIENANLISLFLKHKLFYTFISNFQSKNFEIIFESLLQKLSYLPDLKHIESISDVSSRGRGNRRGGNRGSRNRHLFADRFESGEGEVLEGLYEEVLQQLISMGFVKEQAELGLNSIEYPSAEAATDWILSHPEDIRKLEEQQLLNTLNAKEQNPDIILDQICIGKKYLGFLNNENFKEKVFDIQWKLTQYLYSHIISFNSLGRPIWEFLNFALEGQKIENQSKIISELFASIKIVIKETLITINPKIKSKNSKEKIIKFEFLNPIEIPKSEGNITNKIEQLMILINLILKTTALDSSKKNPNKHSLLKEQTCLDLAKIWEKIVEESEESVLLSNFLQKILILINEITSNIDTKQEFKKNLLILLINFIIIHNKKPSKGLLKVDSLQGLFKLILYCLMGNIQNIKFFIEKKYLQELLKIELSKYIESINGCLLGLFYKIFETVLIDKEIETLHLEALIKKYFFDNKSNPILLNDFINEFKIYNKNEIFQNVVKNLCIITKNKEITNIKINNESNFITKLPFKQQNVNSPKLENIADNGLQILTSFIESIIIQFNQNPKNKNLVCNYSFLLKILHLLIRKYPIILPYLLKINCSKPIKKYCLENNFQLKLLAANNTTHISFLKYFTRVICFYANENNFYPILAEICLDNYIISENGKEQVLFSMEIRQKVLNNIYHILKTELDQSPSLLDPLTVHIFCSFTSLHVYLLRIIEISKLSIRNEELIHTNFFRLYSEAYKNAITSSINCPCPEQLSQLLTTPLSILYQLSLAFSRKKIPEKKSGLSGQMISIKILKDDSQFFNNWRTISSTLETNCTNILDINPARFLIHRIPVVQNPPNPDLQNIYIEPSDSDSEEIDELPINQDLPSEQNIPIPENQQNDSAWEDENIEEEPSALEERESVSNDSENEEEEELEDDIENDDESDHEQIIDEGDDDNIEDEESDSEGEVIGIEHNNYPSEKELIRGFDTSGFQNILAFEHTLDPELNKFSLAMQKGIKNLMKNGSKEGVLKEIEVFQNEINTGDSIEFLNQGFFSDWKSNLALNYNKNLNIPEISPLLPKDRDALGYLRTYYPEFEGDEDFFMMLERGHRALAGDREERSPMGMFHNLINERGEIFDREDLFRAGNIFESRGYFNAFRHHLDVLSNRNAVRAVGRIDPEELQRNPPVNREISQDNINNFRENILRNVAIENVEEIKEEIQNPPQNNEIQNNAPENLNEKKEENQNPEQNMEIEIEEGIKNNNNIIEENQTEINIVPNTQQISNILPELKVQEINPLPENQEENKIDIPQQIEPLPQNLQENKIDNPQPMEIEIKNSPLLEEVKEDENQTNKIEGNFEEKLIISESQLPPLLENPINEIQNPIESSEPFGINFEDLGLPADFLQIHNIDPNYFNSLSEDMKNELILQHIPRDPSESNPVPEEQKINEIQNLLEPDQQEFVNAMPENIREEILREQLDLMGGGDARPHDDMDNATFLASLTNELRYEVLLTASNEFLESLPAEIQTEAQNLRDRANLRAGNSNRYARANQPVINKKKEKKIENNETSLIVKDKTLLNRLGNIDEKILEGLLDYLYLERNEFARLPVGLLETLMKHVGNESKIIDALIYLLGLEEFNIENKGFPRKYLTENGKILKNYDQNYKEISLRVLFLLSKFTNTHTQCFISEEKKVLESLTCLKTEKPEKKIFQKLLELLDKKIFKQSWMHLDLLIISICNVAEWLKTVKITELILDKQTIGLICQVLSIDFVDESIMRRLSQIISIFSLQTNNLEFFIDELQSIILKISKRINFKLENALKELRFEEKIDSLLFMNSLESQIEEEQKIFKIFKIIKEIFEKPQEQSETRRKSFESLIKHDDLNSLWANVTEILVLFNEKMPNTVNFLNPAIHKLLAILECFFMIYSILHEQNKADSLKKTDPKISALEENSIEEINIKKTVSIFKTGTANIDEMFEILCEQNKKVINMMIRQNPSLLNESLQIVVERMSKILEFDIKKMYFRRELKKLRNDRDRTYPIKIKINRTKIFYDSFNEIKKQTSADMRRKVYVEFIGEEGIDQGGLTREWYNLLSKEMFNQNYALFVRASNGATFQPDPRSVINPDHLFYFKFVGRIIGKALYDGYLVDAFFTRAFYKHILGKPINIHDMEDIDPQYFKNLKWILENDISDLDLTFSYEFEKFGKLDVIDLIKDGRNIQVNNDNKADYVQKICYAKMALDIQEQIKAFLSGFNELIPNKIISIFDSMELELMISGLPDIDVQDLKENTEYRNYTKDSQIIQWFWDVVEGIDKSEKAALIQFVTGTSKVPIEGFKALKGINGCTKFSINKTYDSSKLPTSHTCFNQLDLPEYPTKEILKNKLLFAIREGKEGFGFL